LKEKIRGIELMNLAEILTSALYLTDAEGNRKAIVLDIAVWQEILALLEAAEAKRQQVELGHGDYTVERQQWLGRYTLDELLAEMKQSESQVPPDVEDK
jgi:hypothetical protein